MDSRFSCLTPGMERFLLDLLGAVKIEDVIWKWGVGVFLERVFSFFFGREVL